jgi:NOL1/NOP2/fmu family ribosome biogenesis protein/23S rRNA U2552 (ribose-2'-O)-methylase RlmE/FtsJ
MQDPGAMSALSAVDISPDMWVADLCSAPGGKSSQVAERLGDGGFLLSNEYVPKRAKIVVSNFERLGVRRALVTSLDTSEIAKTWGPVFDLVICDAPCSGEGMFRKSEDAVELWSHENVMLCAERQKEIIENAARLVKGGGRLLYSTCTYSREENEDIVEHLLTNFPEFSLIPVKDKLREATRDGLAPYRDARRFYPHVTPGEGQFVALFKKADDGSRAEIKIKDDSRPLSKAEEGAVLGFFKENLNEIPGGRLRKVGENIVLIDHDCPIPARGVFMSGTLVGEYRSNILIPSHQLFTVHGKLFKRQVELSEHTDLSEKYLLGEEIDAPDTDMRGYAAILFRGAPLGGGKISNGKIKNHYPKGLRNKK